MMYGFLFRLVQALKNICDCKMSKIYKLNASRWELRCNPSVYSILKDLCIQKMRLNLSFGSKGVEVFDNGSWKLGWCAEICLCLLKIACFNALIMPFEGQIILFSGLIIKVQSTGKLPFWCVEVTLQHSHSFWDVWALSSESLEVWNRLLHHIHRELIDRVITIACEDLCHQGSTLTLLLWPTAFAGMD